MRKCREWNDDLKPFGLRYAAWRLFLLERFIPFARQGNVLYSIEMLTLYVIPRTLLALKDDGV